MLRVISSVEAVERLKAAGFNTNVNRLNAGQSRSRAGTRPAAGR